MNREGIKKHKKVFDQWLDGAEVEVKPKRGAWGLTDSPLWAERQQYRAKPKQWTQYVVRYMGCTGLVAAKIHSTLGHAQEAYNGHSEPLTVTKEVWTEGATRPDCSTVIKERERADE